MIGEEMHGLSIRGCGAATTCACSVCSPLESGVGDEGQRPNSCTSPCMSPLPLPILAAHPLPIPALPGVRHGRAPPVILDGGERWIEIENECDMWTR